eukprot:288431_1
MTDTSSIEVHNSSTYLTDTSSTDRKILYKQENTDDLTASDIDTSDSNNNDQSMAPAKKLKSKVKLMIVSQRLAKYSFIQKQKISMLPNVDKFKNQDFMRSSAAGFFNKNPRLISSKVHQFRTIIVVLFTLILSAITICAVLQRDMSPYYVSYAAILTFISLLFVFLDYFDNFHLFQSYFESSCHNHSQSIFLISFCLTAFIDYVLIGLEEDGIIDGRVALIIIDVLYYIALVLFFCTWMAYWKAFSFYCSEKSSLHALFYLTIIGYIIIVICRWLRPVAEEDNAWHRKHKITSILSAIMYVIIFLFVFCVILGGIGIAAFAEFAKQSASFGVGIAILGFCSVSMIIMLTPLAPGSIVDACGGFVFIQLLSDPNQGPNYNFFISWGIAIVAVCVLHFTGACTQWWLGTWPCIQIWANKTLPIEMLAASDAVLRDAGVVKVGLVGYIFMDTANGLNQGRINMDFWIQLFSEWTSIPNALGLVSLGATIAAQALELDDMDWTIIAVPLFILFSTLIQTAGGTFGARAMGDSTDSVKYWTSREKWTMFQFFQSEGYSPTRDGWNEDCFNLSKSNEAHSDQFETQLFEMVAPLHCKYIESREKAKDSAERLKIFEQYRDDLTRVREIHYKNFDEVKDEYVKQGWLLYEEPQSTSTGYFSVGPDDIEDLPRWKVQLWAILCGCATFAFWVSFYGIYLQSSLQLAVKDGIGTLNNVDLFGWASCITFAAIVSFVYHIEIYSTCTSGLQIFKWLCTGCTINRDTETKFETPKWD